MLLTTGLMLISLGEASAKDMAGKIGLGIDNTMAASFFGIGNNTNTSNNNLNGNSTVSGDSSIPVASSSRNGPSLGLSLKYWIDNDWALCAVLGFVYATGDATTGNLEDDDFWAFALDVKGIYNFAKSENANLGVYLDFHIRKESTTDKRPSGPFGSSVAYAIALGLTPEVFLTSNFAITGEIGLALRIQRGFAIGISGDNLLGGLGFHYYF